MRILKQTVRSLLLTALIPAPACGTAMQLTIENRGGAVEVHALCGDAMYEAALASAGSVAWAPSANSCHLSLRGDSGSRRLTIRNRCVHAHGCALQVALPGAPPARLSGSGQIEILGEQLTTAPH